MIFTVNYMTVLHMQEPGADKGLPLPPMAHPGPHLGCAALKIKVLTQVMRHRGGRASGTEAQLFPCSLPRATGDVSNQDTCLSLRCPWVGTVTPAGSRGLVKGQKSWPGVLEAPGLPVPIGPSVVPE